mgnify:CR=1 FL=1
MIRFVLMVILVTSLGLIGCSGTGDDSNTADSSPADMAPILADAGLAPDAGSPISLRVVPGSLTYTATQGGSTHIFSVTTEGDQKQRLTSESAAWSFHSVSPNARYIAAVQHASQDDLGRPDLSSDGEVWVIDVQASRSYALSPAECDAGIGGVSWLNDGMLVFSMACGEAPAALYLADFTDESRDLTRLLKISDHPFPVRDANAALGTSVVSYVVDSERCIDGVCVTKPQIWITDSETNEKCQVTDADREFISLEGHDVANRRVGDHSPAFTDQLRGLVFTRNVPIKTPGPSGHHDLLRVGLNLRAFFDGDIRCEQPGTEANLSDTLIGDGYPEGLFEHERFPQPAVGERAPDGAMLFVGRRHTTPQSSVAYVSDLAGSKVAVSHPSEWVVYARWVVSDLMLTGSRD